MVIINKETEEAKGNYGTWGNGKGNARACLIRPFVRVESINTRAEERGKGTRVRANGATPPRTPNACGAGATFTWQKVTSVWVVVLVAGGLSQQRGVVLASRGILFRVSSRPTGLLALRTEKVS